MSSKQKINCVEFAYAQKFEFIQGQYCNLYRITHLVDSSIDNRVRSMIFPRNWTLTAFLVAPQQWLVAVVVHSR